MFVSWLIPIANSPASEPVYVREPVEIMRVVELPAGPEYHHRVLPFERRSPLDRGFYFGHGFHAVYLTRVLPGRQYTLGFRYAANWRKRVKVMLFDRWLLASQARHFNLLQGPILRGRSDQVELRWQLSVSPDSPGTLLYIVVEATDTIPDYYGGFPHDLFLAWPPIESRNEMGYGVTYLQGPKNLMLAEQVPGAPVVLTNIEPGKPNPAPLPAWKAPGDLIVNGAFTQGIQHWSSIQSISSSKQQTATFPVGPDGLVLHGNEDESIAGVRQQLEVNVRGAARLMLQARVKIVRQTKPGSGKKADISPLSISVCYDDAGGGSHCGKDAYTSRFYSLESNSRKSIANGQRIPAGEWFWFMQDLMRLSPSPVRIRSVSLLAAGWPEWQSNIREIHLIRHGGTNVQQGD
ncbi:hypothetical protein MNBD_GAMMA24-2615 [hydrothermal vent metagenome]|uniref:Uncharacterized protein n=1 Tax=hydrothermal vent metagenome TaxID=652676 RepID=A0A3B1B8N5_9ZZZZ